MLRNLSVITQLERSRAGFCTQVLLLPRTPLAQQGPLLESGGWAGLEAWGMEGGSHAR